MVYDVYTMERYQIYLEREQKRELERIARLKGSSVSGIIREAVDSYMAGNRPKPIERIEDHPLWGLVGMIKDQSMPADSAENHDKYIYGRDVNR